MIKKMMMALAAVVLLAGPVAADHSGPHEGVPVFLASSYYCTNKEAALGAANAWVNGVDTTELDAYIIAKAQEDYKKGFTVCGDGGGRVTPVALVGTFNRLSDNEIMYVIKTDAEGLDFPLYMFFRLPLVLKGLPI